MMKKIVIKSKHNLTFRLDDTQYWIDGQWVMLDRCYNDGHGTCVYEFLVIPDPKPTSDAAGPGGE